METIRFKRGDTFSPTCTTDQPITGYTIASQIRTKTNKLISTLVPAIAQSTPIGVFTLTHSGSTQTWPVETLYWDIQYTNGSGKIVSTDTVELEIEKDITQP